MRYLKNFLTVALCAPALSGCIVVHEDSAPASIAGPAIDCPSGYEAGDRAEMYVGRVADSAEGGQSLWHAFIMEELRPRFGSGFTIVETDGGWRAPDGGLLREPSRVIVRLFLGGMSASDTVAWEALGEAYVERFDQHSILIAVSPACVRFHPEG